MTKYEILVTSPAPFEEYEWQAFRVETVSGCSMLIGDGSADNPVAAFWQGRLCIAAELESLAAQAEMN